MRLQFDRSMKNRLILQPHCFIRIIKQDHFRKRTQQLELCLLL